MAFTRDTQDYEIIRDLDNTVQNQATSVKADFDQAGEQQKDFMNNTLLAELENSTLGTSAAENLGYPNLSYPTVYDIIEFILSAGSGSIPPDLSVSYPKLDLLLRQVVDLEPITPTSGTSTTITITVPQSTTVRTTILVENDITGGAITINKNGAGAKPLEDGEGNAIEELLAETRYYDVIEESTQYVLVAGGGTMKGYEDVLVSTSTSLNVTGKGTIIAFVPNARGSLSSSVTINSLTVDGTDLLASTSVTLQAGDTDGVSAVGIPVPIRYKTGFSISASVSGGTLNTFYVLE